MGAQLCGDQGGRDAIRARRFCVLAVLWHGPGDDAMVASKYSPEARALAPAYHFGSGRGVPLPMVFHLGLARYHGR